MNVTNLKFELEYLEKLLTNVDKFTNKPKINIFVDYKLNLIRDFLKINKECKQYNTLNKKITSKYKLKIQKYQKLLLEEENKIKINTQEYDYEIKDLENELKNYSNPKILKEIIYEKEEENNDNLDIYILKKKKFNIVKKINKSKSLIKTFNDKIDILTKNFNENYKKNTNLINEYYLNIPNDVSDKITTYNNVREIKENSNILETEFKIKRTEYLDKICCEKEKITNLYQEINSIHSKKKEINQNMIPNYEEINKTLENNRIEEYNKIKNKINSIKIDRQEYINNILKIKEKSDPQIKLYNKHIYELKKSYNKISNDFIEDIEIYSKKLQYLESLKKEICK